MSAVLHRSLHKELPTVTGGEGIYLFDSSGKRYIDASGGAAVSCLGHGREEVFDAISTQLREIAYAHSSYFYNTPSEKLADFLVKKAPAGFGNGKAMFLGSGSEAMEAALKLARQYHLERGDPDRTRVIGREMAYHGNTLGALSVGGHAARRESYLPFLNEIGRIPACYSYRLKRNDESEAAFGARMASELEKEINRIGPNNVAAFVCEPVSGATLGSVPPAPGYFKRIREICDRYGVIFIADEVMCGAGRTGSFYALEQEAVAPDIVTVAKGLGAGIVPIGATLASERVIDAISRGSGTLWNGHTYMSHAAACAGAYAVQEIIEKEDLVTRVAHQGAKLEQLLKESFGQHPFVGDIRGRGFFWTLELVADKETKEPFPHSAGLSAAIKKNSQDSGLLVYPSAGCVDGISGDHVLIAPPYIAKEEELGEIVNILNRVLDDTVEVVLGKE